MGLTLEEIKSQFTMLKFYYRKGLFNSTEYIQLLAELETELEKVWKEGNNNAK